MVLLIYTFVQNQNGLKKVHNNNTVHGLFARPSCHEITSMLCFKEPQWFYLLIFSLTYSHQQPKPVLSDGEEDWVVVEDGPQTQTLGSLNEAVSPLGSTGSTPTESGQSTPNHPPPNNHQVNLHFFAVISVSTIWKDCYPLGQFYRGFPNGPTLQQGQIWGQYSYHSHSPFIQDRRVAGIFAPLTFMHHLNAELPFGVLTFHSGRLQAVKY